MPPHVARRQAQPGEAFLLDLRRAILWACPVCVPGGQAISAAFGGPLQGKFDQVRGRGGGCR